MNLNLFDTKFNVDRPCKKLFDLVFRDEACEAKCMECPRASVYL